MTALWQPIQLKMIEPRLPSSARQAYVKTYSNVVSRQGGTLGAHEAGMRAAAAQTAAGKG